MVGRTLMLCYHLHLTCNCTIVKGTWKDWKCEVSDSGLAWVKSRVRKDLRPKIWDLFETCETHFFFVFFLNQAWSRSSICACLTLVNAAFRVEDMGPWKYGGCRGAVSLHGEKNDSVSGKIRRSRVKPTFWNPALLSSFREKKRRRIEDLTEK